MLYVKIQGSEPILLDQTQLTEESIDYTFIQFEIFLLK
jgi:hypothetical protein